MASIPLVRAGMVKECWAFRDFIMQSVRRDFVSRYLGTKLGFFWAIAQPLTMILIYTLIFAELMKPTLPGHPSRFAYSIYLCSGVLIWQLFSDLLNRSVGVFVQNADLLKKVNLPKLALPVIVALSGLSNFAVILSLFLGFLLTIGSFPGASVLAGIPLLVLVIAFGLGLGVFLGTINVFYRDVAQTMSMVLQFWFWLTPIVYAGRSLPDPLRRSSLGIQCRRSWHSRRRSSSRTTCLPGRCCCIRLSSRYRFLLLGLFAFRRLSGEIVDEL